MSLIDIRKLTKIYSVDSEEITAVDNVSMKIDKGDFMSIVGHSGSGKTTLISIIGGILRPTSGEVLFKDTNICNLNDAMLSEYRNLKIGFMFQFASLLPVLTAKENVLLPLVFSPGNSNMSDAQQRAEKFLDMMDVRDKINAYPSQLSGGQQRRVAIARALINSPELILADEPTGDLDEETEAEVMELFHKINSEQGVAFVIVTHNNEIAKSCKKHYIMDRGILNKGD